MQQIFPESLPAAFSRDSWIIAFINLTHRIWGVGSETCRSAARATKTSVWILVRDWVVLWLCMVVKYQLAVWAGNFFFFFFFAAFLSLTFCWARCCCHLPKNSKMLSPPWGSGLCNQTTRHYNWLVVWPQEQVSLVETKSKHEGSQ